MFLGIDWGNGKIKFCLLRLNPTQIHWKSLPFERSKPESFEEGVPANLDRFLDGFGLKREHIKRAVVTSSHFGSYPTFEAAHQHTVAVLRRELPQASLMSIDGTDYSLDKAAKITGKDCARFAGTKFWGTAYLASKLVPDGLSLDTGTTSTDIIPLVGGEVDPEGKEDPTSFHLRRMASGRLCWIGMTATPLDYISPTIETPFGQYTLFPRLGYSEAIAALFEWVPPELAKLHAYGGLYPTKEQAAFYLAQAVGGDRLLLNPEEIEAIARALHGKMIERISASIVRVGVTGKRAVVSGIGRMLAREALERAGFSDIVDLDERLGHDHLASASSAYGLALFAAEKEGGKALSLLP